MLFFNLMKGRKEVARLNNYYSSEIKKAMKIGIVEALRQVTISTPVDTGRARWGWFLTINVPSVETPLEGKYSAPKINERMQAINDNFTISDTLYLTNNVDYIGRLNDGYSKQAPARFVEKSAKIAQQAVTRYLKSGRG